MSFDGRTAVVTGGGIGFGRAFARALVAEGASVALADIDIDMAERTAAELVSAGGQAIAVRCDVADEEQVDAAVAVTADQFGGIDILINNAGRHLTKYNQPFGVLSRNEIRGLFDVNVIGVINATLACRDSMRDRGGGVVLNILSMAGYLSATPYAVSKLAVRGLTVAFATELAPDPHPGERHRAGPDEHGERAGRPAATVDRRIRAGTSARAPAGHDARRGVGHAVSVF